jgi:outer membrane protein
VKGLKVDLSRTATHHARVMRVRILLALICSAFCVVSPAAEPSRRFLTLRECVDLALTHSLDLQIEHLTLESAQFGLNASYGAYDPTFSFQIRRDYVATPSDFDPKKNSLDYPYELTTDSVNPSLSGRLPYGLSYNLSGIASERDTVSDFRSNPSLSNIYAGGFRYTNNYYADGGLSLQQHLLKDFWTDQYRAQIQIKRKDLKMSQEALRFQVMRTVLAVELAYYDLVAARENVRVQDQAVDLRQQLLGETKRRVDVGDLPPLDAEQAQTQLQNTLTLQTSAQDILLSRQNTLKSLLTDDFRSWLDVDLEPAEPLVALPVTINKSESLQNALRNRPDLAQARIAVERDDVQVKFRYNQLFPNLDLLGRYGGVGIQPDGSTAVSDALHFRNPQYYYGVVVSFPLSNTGERNNYRASKALKRIAELQLKKAEQDVLVQVTDFANRVKTHFSQVDSTRQARIYAESALSAEVKKLQNGLSTSFFVLQLQETLTAARTTEIQALADYNKIQAQLAFAEGTTLDKHHLSVGVK